MEVRQRNQKAEKGSQHHHHLSAGEVIHETAEVTREVVEKVTEKLTCMWDELPSYLKSLKSLSYWHNESVNIYTHLLGAVFFGLLSWVLYITLEPRYPSATASDIYAFLCFFAGCLFCLGMSAFYHTICNHSYEAARWFNVLDYVGIVGLITGSFIPSVYYGFKCETALRDRYWTMVHIKLFWSENIITLNGFGFKQDGRKMTDEDLWWI
ncbi:hypothetical protein TWF694_010321 [Orbilia ellipsospora]|uniref:Uncharacterized protein n=1 Tax=Orbilia ellipsospora TaxID=2528407 RepID=A0AAV9X9I0_9PEZI